MCTMAFYDKGETGRLKLVEKLSFTTYSFFWRHFNKEEVVFYAREPVHYVMFREIHRFLPGVRVVATGKEVQKYLRSLGVSYRSGYGYPRIVISPRLLRLSYNIPEIKKITIFHGMAKDVLFNPRHRIFDLLLVMGDYAAERFTAMGLHQFKIVGYPKIDRLFDGSIDKKAFETKLGLDPGKKTILYAPTWGSKSSLPYLAEELAGLGEKYNLLLKLHDKSTARWQKIIEKQKNIYLLKDPDIVPYYLLADMLISDYSSVIFEFSVLDRPIVLFDIDHVKHATKSIGYNWRDIGIRVKSCRELPAAVRRSFDNPEEFKEKRQEYARRLFKYRDGSAAQRAAAEIRDFCRKHGVFV